MSMAKRGNSKVNSLRSDSTVETNACCHATERLHDKLDPGTETLSSERKTVLPS